MFRAQGPILLNFLISLRPGQWTKNLFVFAARVFAPKLWLGLWALSAILIIYQ